MNIRQAQLPEGWEIEDLGSVCHVQRGLTYSGKDTVDISDQVVLRATNIDLGSAKLIFDELKYLREDLEIKSTYSLKKDSLLICFSSGSKSHLGKIALVDDDYPNFYFGGFIGQITPSDQIDSQYLFYCLSSENYKDYISNLTDGVNINNLKAVDLKAFQIPLPPLPEQQRIVSILDKAFAAIDTAKANAERCLSLSKDLFESYLQGVFASTGSPTENGDWETKNLGSLCDLITKGSSPKWQGINYVDEPGILFVTSENVGEGEMLLDKRKYVEEKFNQKDKKSILKNGDVLTNIVGASIGRTAIYDIDDVANINQAVCILRCNPELINNRYLMNLLNSPFLKKILHDNEVNTARANLSLGFFNKLEIPYPSIEDQQTIIFQLDALRAETQKLEAVYQKKLEDLEELKKSILQKAFAGELETETLETAQ